MIKQISSQFGFYAVLTNPLRGYEYCTQLCVDHKIAFVQLRVKECPLFEIQTLAENMKKITDGSSTKLIINDYPSVAVDIDADGVHVGQNDVSYSDVRSMVGDNKIIGVSTHSEQQALNTNAYKPNYIGAGPVFLTPTKKIPDPVIGISGLKVILSCSSVPVVAIGGIDLDNFREILDAGAINFCMVRQFTQSPDPERILKTIKTMYNEYFPDFY